MNSLKKITYNCRMATFLIEKKNIAGISFKEEFELKYHLVGCSVCRLFQKQSLLIDKMVRNSFLNSHNIKINGDFKAALEKRIAEELKKGNG
ncbi:hypothetical protein [Pedobacter sandarakinus]|uniref:hypothetical protein n=1 Tax=Pedobacter sandarakinus TaxID=353156 RepID=UPI0022477C9E|nr:hypothetical protein [Pedobacter sandarakinus]MCX2575607.1 hypothetical protein [Pedobacter sandarakinus]